MRDTLCGADCEKCPLEESCRGCTATCGMPFGGTCVAAEYIKRNGKKAYATFKRDLLEEANLLLDEIGAPPASGLVELAGSFVNLAYPLPSGKAEKLLDDTKIYLGAQIQTDGDDVCYGAVADTEFILISRYRGMGAEPELVAFKRR